MALTDFSQFKVPIAKSLLGSEKDHHRHIQHGNSYRNAFVNNISLMTPAPPERPMHLNWGAPLPPHPQAMPQRPLFPPLYEESTHTRGMPFYNQGFMSSTPLHRLPGSQQKRSIMQAAQTSSSWLSSIGGNGGLDSSHNRGGESVRSWTNASASLTSASSQAPDFCDKVMQRALNLYLERSGVNPDFKNVAVQVINEIRCYVEEAAQDIGSINGSVKSHFSKYASSMRSVFSKISDRNDETILSIFKNGCDIPPTLRDRAVSPTKSFQCSVKRLSRAEKKEIGNEAKITLNIVSRTLPSQKRAREDEEESSSSDNDTMVCRMESSCAANEAPAKEDHRVMECDSGDEKLTKEHVTIRRGKLERRRTKIRMKKIGSESKERSEVGSETAVAATTITTAPHKQKRNLKRAKLEPSTKAVKLPLKRPLPPTKPKNSPAAAAVCQTRSGRQVKRPAFYHDASSAVLDSQTGPQVVYKKPTDHAKASLAVESGKLEPLAVAPGRRGRQVNKKITANETNKSSGPTEMVPLKVRPTSKKRTGKKTKQTVDVQQPAQIGDPHKHEDVNDISFGDDSFCIPEVTQSTRRALGRARGLKNIGAHTPPLMHLTANLNPLFLKGSTPSQQTPDWHISQRTQSEVKQLQKRKAPKKKGLSKPLKPVPPRKMKKPSKEEAEMLKLVRGARPRGTAGLQVLAHQSYLSSDDEEEE